MVQLWAGCTTGTDAVYISMTRFIQQIYRPISEILSIALKRHDGSITHRIFPYEIADLIRSRCTGIDDLHLFSGHVYMIINAEILESSASILSAALAGNVICGNKLTIIASAKTRAFFIIIPLPAKVTLPTTRLPPG